MKNNLMNFTGDNKNFDESNDSTSIQQLTNVIGKIANMMGQNAMTTQNINKQLGIVSSSVNAMGERVNRLDERMYQIENNEEITTDMANNIRRSVNKKVFDIVGDDPLEQAKYYRPFVKRLWSEAKKEGGCAHEYARTQKRNYQKLIDYIEAWIPNGGIGNLKKEVDEKAKVNKNAKAAGYY